MFENDRRCSVCLWGGALEGGVWVVYEACAAKSAFSCPSVTAVGLLLETGVH